MSRWRVRVRLDSGLCSSGYWYVTATPDYETGTAVVDGLSFVQLEHAGALYLWRDGQTNGYPIWTVDDLHDALDYVPPAPALPPPPTVEESLARIAEALDKIAQALDNGEHDNIAQSLRWVAGYCANRT